MPTISKVVENAICVGCGACSVRTDGAIPVRLNRDGYFSADLSGVDQPTLARASQVCPFAHEAADEDAISKAVIEPSPFTDSRIGRYRTIHAGRTASSDYLQGSSSGGLTSWMAGRLLEAGEVDGVIHVGRGDDGLFCYQLSHSLQALRAQRKSAYYSTTLAQVLQQIRGDERRYALVGVPCFIKAARLLCLEDPVLDRQLVFFLGLVCGHLKSAAFAELLAWQTGVAPDELEAVDFRVKAPDRDAGQYDFGALRKGSTEWLTRPTQSLRGGNWGHGMFQLNACNYCDDIFAETADVAFGDAWLPQYRQDWRGTNIVVTRHAILQRLLEEGFAKGEIELEELSADDASNSQGGNFRHRREGLAVRLADDISHGKWVPNKRVLPSVTAVTTQRLALIRNRRLISEASHALYRKARERSSLSYFLDNIEPYVRRYERCSRPAFYKRLYSRLKRYFSAAGKRVYG
ncbi:Coenzyme F420 hydrogenase/dehydrogenase, beta subunit C-terminal domain [Stutzerimonas tarimensis]|uniref:Coenzyme F420 hydrogenase/dehydrogenase, beta subunit C-terminal domain n=1 Tax=Stutzerimonas tarimensis TaxID=1507735 RepID=A0ABV7T8K4_9GAMM